MQKGFWVIHLNSFGMDLDRSFVEDRSRYYLPQAADDVNEIDIKNKLIEMICENVVAAGDSFKVEEGESEQ